MTGSAEDADMSGDPHHPGERRPIAVRKWKIFQDLARALARRGFSPNAISVAGMLCGIGAGIALAATGYLPSFGQRLAWLAGALLIQLRLLANMLDGMVAIEGGKASPVGELYNEVPDRVSDVATLIGAGYAAGGSPALGYLAACVALFAAYVRAMGKAAGANQEFCGPMAKQQRMFVVTVIAVYCAVVPENWHPVWTLSPAPPPSPSPTGGEGMGGGWGLMAAALVLIILGGIVTVIRRLFRIAATLTKGAP
jgi:phosphatidylglycerophosphate synthase